MAASNDIESHLTQINGLFILNLKNASQKLLTDLENKHKEFYTSYWSVFYNLTCAESANDKVLSRQLCQKIVKFHNIAPSQDILVSPLKAAETVISMQNDLIRLRDCNFTSTVTNTQINDIINIFKHHLTEHLNKTIDFLSKLAQTSINKQYISNSKYENALHNLQNYKIQINPAHLDDAYKLSTIYLKIDEIVLEMKTLCNFFSQQQIESHVPIENNCIGKIPTLASAGRVTKDSNIQTAPVDFQAEFLKKSFSEINDIPSKISEYLTFENNTLYVKFKAINDFWNKSLSLKSIVAPVKQQGNKYYIDLNELPGLDADKQKQQTNQYILMDNNKKVASIIVCKNKYYVLALDNLTITCPNHKIKKLSIVSNRKITLDSPLESRDVEIIANQAHIKKHVNAETCNLYIEDNIKLSGKNASKIKTLNVFADITDIKTDVIANSVNIGATHASLDNIYATDVTVLANHITLKGNIQARNNSQLELSIISQSLCSIGIVAASKLNLVSERAIFCADSSLEVFEEGSFTILEKLELKSGAVFHFPKNIDFNSLNESLIKGDIIIDKQNKLTKKTARLGFGKIVRIDGNIIHINGNADTTIKVVADNIFVGGIIQNHTDAEVGVKLKGNSISVSGKIATNNGLNISASQELIISGKLISTRYITIRAKALTVEEMGHLQANSTNIETVADILVENDSQIEAIKFQIQADNFSQHGTLKAKSLSVNAENTVYNKGKIECDNQVYHCNYYWHSGKNISKNIEVNSLLYTLDYGSNKYESSNTTSMINLSGARFHISSDDILGIKNKITSDPLTYISGFTFAVLSEAFPQLKVFSTLYTAMNVLSNGYEVVKNFCELYQSEDYQNQSPRNQLLIWAKFLGQVAKQVNSAGHVALSGCKLYHAIPKEPPCFTSILNAALPDESLCQNIASLTLNTAASMAARQKTSTSLLNIDASIEPLTESTSVSLLRATPLSLKRRDDEISLCGIGGYEMNLMGKVSLTHNYYILGNSISLFGQNSIIADSVTAIEIIVTNLTHDGYIINCINFTNHNQTFSNGEINADNNIHSTGKTSYIGMSISCNKHNISGKCKLRYCVVNGKVTKVEDSSSLESYCTEHNEDEVTLGDNATTHYQLAKGEIKTVDQSKGKKSQTTFEACGELEIGNVAAGQNSSHNVVHPLNNFKAYDENGTLTYATKKEIVVGGDDADDPNIAHVPKIQYGTMGAIFKSTEKATIKALQSSRDVGVEAAKNVNFNGATLGFTNSAGFEAIAKDALNMENTTITNATSLSLKGKFINITGSDIEMAAAQESNITIQAQNNLKMDAIVDTKETTQDKKSFKKGIPNLDIETRKTQYARVNKINAKGGTIYIASEHGAVLIEGTEFIAKNVKIYAHDDIDIKGVVTTNTTEGIVFSWLLLIPIGVELYKTSDDKVTKATIKAENIVIESEKGNFNLQDSTIDVTNGYVRVAGKVSISSTKLRHESHRKRFSLAPTSICGIPVPSPDSQESYLAKTNVGRKINQVTSAEDPVDKALAALDLAEDVIRRPARLLFDSEIRTKAGYSQTDCYEETVKESYMNADSLSMTAQSLLVENSSTLTYDNGVFSVNDIKATAATLHKSVNKKSFELRAKYDLENSLLSGAGFSLVSDHNIHESHQHSKIKGNNTTFRGVKTVTLDGATMQAGELKNAQGTVVKQNDRQNTSTLNHTKINSDIIPCLAAFNCNYEKSQSSKGSTTQSSSFEADNIEKLGMLLEHTKLDDYENTSSTNCKVSCSPVPFTLNSRFVRFQYEKKEKHVAKDKLRNNKPDLKKDIGTFVPLPLSQQCCSLSHSICN